MQRETFGFRSGGLHLVGDLFLPDGPGPWPTTVCSSGFGGVKEMLLHEYGTALADAGVACLAFDYPNFGASEGRRRQHIDPPRMSRSYDDAVVEIAGHPAVDPGRLGVWGPSLAGGFTLATAARLPQVRSAVAIMPFIRLTLDRPDVQLALEVTKDVVGRALGRPPRTVPVAGPPGSLAAMNTDGAEDWIRQMTVDAPAFRNEVTTASLLNMMLLSNRTAARRVRVPLRVVLAEADTITPAPMVRNDAVRASVVDWFLRTL